ncbi:MAG: type 4a pilus biogenesis protein PilO, partial [Planctomycetota bacterium]
LDWLKTSAVGAGLEIERVMPEVVIEREGVAVRPVVMQAEGEWSQLVSWLQEIEASPRRLILREVNLQTLRNRVVAELKLAVMIDRPTGVAELAKLDVASLRGEELDRAVTLIETELQGKSQAFNQLGADASWSRPIADLTALMPTDARPVTLRVGRYANGERAQRYTGSFTLLLPDAGEVPTYVRRLQKQDGFADAALRSLRRAGAAWQRATVTFAFTGPGLPDATRPAGIAAVEAEQN